jgi:prolyl oligopeptidase
MVVSRSGTAKLCAVVVLLGGATLPGATNQRGAQEPNSRTVDHVDVYHGVAVRDPYRWLEDATAPETRAWVNAQNQLVETYLNTAPFRRQVEERVRALNAFTRTFGPKPCCGPFQAGPYIFFAKQEAGQPQPVVYVQRGSRATPEVLLNPNEWSVDGTASLGQFAPSRNGRYVVYGVRQGGSQWQEYRVIEVGTRRHLSDRLQWIIGQYTAWHGDGFFYARPAQPPAGQELTVLIEHHSVYYHRLGTPPGEDRLIHREPEHPKRHYNLLVSADDRTAILLSSAPEGGGRYTDVRVRDLDWEGPWRSITSDASIDFDVVDVTGNVMLARTTLEAPRGRIVRINLQAPEPANWQTLVPEQDDLMQLVTAAGGRLFIRYFRDVASRVRVHRLDGMFEHELALPGVGLVKGILGGPSDDVVFYIFTSLATPDTIYRYEIATRTSTVFAQPRISAVDPNDFETTQVFYTGKDGTRIPMFLTHKKGLSRNGTHPTLLEGYGAFGAITWPMFDASRLALLEQGFIYALANIRGGGEYGAAWHEAGRGLRRQTTFDDFIAAAEWLIANKYTSASRLAIHGVSSGGTLVGAVVNQRPELFRAAVPEAGVMDMLRFQRFTGGAQWTVETGSSDDPEQFKFLLGYSPLHNIRRDAEYPAILVLIADRDDRVVPAHSYKYAAALQSQVNKARPVLVRIDSQSGHASSSLRKEMSTAAAMYTFLMRELKARPTPVRLKARPTPVR